MSGGAVWILTGLALGAVELLLPGYILLGFSAGAILTGVLVGIGALAATGGLTFLVAAAISLLAWLAATRRWGRQPGQNRVWTRDEDVNANAVPRRRTEDPDDDGGQ
ncbi:MAG: hypothetical protein DI556_13150 [Rhodovulum sulfidophilum]|uniref:NfeD family protein n=1 Tax=Rhodovulum sulfidophilum TaxID=35806 RepID=A0A2W5N8Z2_RHOSU|nr:MAG: hypothetical protein DI556_13150 [Rhodovulum sulfidophilum]